MCVCVFSLKRITLVWKLNAIFEHLEKLKSCEDLLEKQYLGFHGFKEKLEVLESFDQLKVDGKL